MTNVSEQNTPLDKSATIFITGATGFLGTSLTRQLLADGWHVRGMSRSKPKLPLGLDCDVKDVWEHPNFEHVSGDVKDVDSLTRGMTGCKYVLSLAGYARNYARDPKVFFDVNVDGMRNVLNVANQLGVEKIVWVSTIVSFGPTPKGQTCDETLARITDKYYTEYEESKSVAEKEALQFAKRGTPLVIVNPTRIYGPGQLSEGNAMAGLIRDYRRGTAPFLLNYGVNYGNYGYVEDVARGVFLALERGRIGERYILGGDNASLLELYRMIDKIDGKKHCKLPMYKFMPLLVAHILKLWARLTGVYPRITPGWVRTFLVDWKYSCDKAKKELGYAPIPLEQGLRSTIEWLDRIKADEKNKKK
ncbi:MAG: NAD-dependent epimerase/dehydratase family protein [Thermoguttaceae bacterium]|nr:NAD-dependent epimerase/dehydratase family protein [Thermoguttaceae bacterium]MBQ2555154.1 NAD-dependent epimerase/dehydratase family protein [Thermoguttaceae bacterium]MBQ5367325.1 NAD-dependent epimerase/dehydratase family protein [Thermoguttaceae bacterium]